MLLVLLALALRLALLAGLYAKPSLFDAAYVTDRWDQIAHNLLDGHGFSWVKGGGVPTITRAPGYAVFLAALIRVTGNNLLAMRIIYLALDSLLVWVTIRLAWKVTQNRRAALGSGLFYAVYLLPAWHIAKLSPDAFFSFVLVGAVAAMLVLIDRETRRSLLIWAIAAGVCLGLAILTRSSHSCSRRCGWLCSW